MARGILHAIYWRLHTFFLKNDRERAAKFLAMLEDELKHAPEALEKEIGEIHMQRFNKIRQRMAIGEFGRLYGTGASCPLSSQYHAHVEPSGPEKDFHKILIAEDGRKALFHEAHIREWASMCHEVDLQEYGKCDFVIREGRLLHVVEVKMGEAPSSVVSQIDRYRLCAELEMCCGIHDSVMAVVMAESFPTYVMTELSRLNVAMLLHRGTPDSIERIETEK
jgi:hypothetical protein